MCLSKLRGGDLNLKDRIRAIREHADLSQEEFGKRIGIKRSAVSLIENGKNNITEQIVKLVCNEFGINEKWLREGKEDMFKTSEDLLELISSKVASGDLNDTDKKMITNYVTLTPKNRAIFRDFLQKLMN